MSDRFSGAMVTLSMELYEAILERVKHEPGCEVLEYTETPVGKVPHRCSCGARVGRGPVWTLGGLKTKSPRRL